MHMILEILIRLSSGAKISYFLYGVLKSRIKNLEIAVKNQKLLSQERNENTKRERR